MRISIAILIIFFSSCGESPTMKRLGGANRYVSAAGDDRNNGSLQAPYKTIGKVNSVITTGDSVFLRRGDSFHGTLSISKSGVSVGAYGEGSKPVITGLMNVSTWGGASTSGVMETNFASSSQVRIVLVNGEQKGVGRYPNLSAANKGWLTLTSHTGTTSIYHPDQSINWTGGELVIRRAHWIIDWNKITSHEGTKVSYQINYTTSRYEPKNGYGYFFQNHVKALDQQGEWCYVNGKLSMYQPTGLVQAATLKNLLIVNASNVKINNIVFKGANENSVLITGNSVHMSECEVLFSGVDAIRPNGTDFRLERSVILNANNSGIEANGSRSVIRHNLIKNTYHIAGMGSSGDGQGIAVEGTPYGLLEYNQIINSGYVAVAMGGNYDVVQYNIIDTFDFIKDDGGAIYDHNGELSTGIGMKIIGNIVLNGVGAREGTGSPNQSSKGIYLDDYCNGYEIRDNLVANCQFGFFIHSAYNNIIRSNTGYNNSNAQIYFQNDTRSGMGRNNTVVDNVWVARVPTQYVFNMFTTFNDVNLIGRIDSNWYARPMDTLNMLKTYYGANAYFSLSQWKKAKPYDEASKYFPISYPKTTNPDSVFRLEINRDSTAKTIALPGTYIDARGRQYDGAITLPPLGWAVLIRTKAPVPPPPTGNSIIIGKPVSGAVFNAPANIAFQATASGTFSKVEFYANNNRFHTENYLPYEFTWSNVARGDYTIVAKATGSNGVVVTSAPITINVK